MFSYLFKKTLWDFLENFFLTVFLNLLLMIPLVLTGFSLFVFFKGEDLIKIIPAVIGTIHLFTIFSGVVARYMYRATKGKPYYWSDFFPFLKESLPGGIIYGLILCGMVGTVIFSVPFYFDMGGVIGAVGAAVTIWFVIILFFVMLYFFPLSIRNGLKGSLKLSFVYMLNNLIFAPVQIIFFVGIAVLSIFTWGTFPGLATAIGVMDNSVTLLEKKYKYIKKNGSQGRIPWNTILRKEKNGLSGKSVRKALFPWGQKDNED